MTLRWYNAPFSRGSNFSCEERPDRQHEDSSRCEFANNVSHGSRAAKMASNLVISLALTEISISY